MLMKLRIFFSKVTFCSRLYSPKQRGSDGYDSGKIELATFEFVI